MPVKIGPIRRVASAAGLPQKPELMRVNALECKGG
ncbi:hypothetical protein ABIE78_000509 [Sinorhizobium fredii]|nr:hypothetical protein N181_24670 [Sinorhizobium fredii USDA 205]